MNEERGCASEEAAADGSGKMAQYRVVCTEQVSAQAHPVQGKIVAVGTNATGGGTATARWRVPEVVAALDVGDYFYTYGEQSGKVARVIKYWCSTCGGEWHIKSAPDAVLDKNLDSLRACAWKAA